MVRKMVKSKQQREHECEKGIVNGDTAVRRLKVGNKYFKWSEVLKLGDDWVIHEDMQMICANKYLLNLIYINM